MKRGAPLAGRTVVGGRISANTGIHWACLFFSLCFTQAWNRINYRRRVPGKWSRICLVSNSARGSRHLTGINRFGLFGVTFLVSWICISVPFCAPACMFYPKGKLHTKKNRAHDRPLRFDSTDFMAEREGFEPPVPLRVRLISSLI